MVNVPFSQLSIAATLLNSASEQITDAAEYLERAGDKPGSRELYALGNRTQSAITKIEAKIRKRGSTTKSRADAC